jgi:hypothetical protein
LVDGASEGKLGQSVRNSNPNLANGHMTVPDHGPDFAYIVYQSTAAFQRRFACRSQHHRTYSPVE